MLSAAPLPLRVGQEAAAGGEAAAAPLAPVHNAGGGGGGGVEGGVRVQQAGHRAARQDPGLADLFPDLGQDSASKQHTGNF